MQLLYDITAELRRRGIHCTDLVMTPDVSKELMTDDKFLEYYNKLDVVTGVIDQSETPDGVVCNGTINVGGTKLTMFTYDEEFEDVDGTTKQFLPKGTMAFLHPGMGTTVYAQVSFVKGEHFESYAEKMVPRYLADESNNVIELHLYSRPVPYPIDWDGWMVTNIYQKKDGSRWPDGADTLDKNVDASANGADTPGGGADTPGNGVDTPGGGADTPSLSDPVLKTETEINKLTSKAAVIEYGESIGLTGLSSESSLADLKTAVINYQQEHYPD